MTAWDIVTEVLQLLHSKTTPGVSPLDIVRLGESEVIKRGGTLYNKGYHPSFAQTPYPHGIVINKNDIIAHGIADDIPFKEGDLVGIDVGVKKDGLCGDAGFTFGVGEISNNDRKLLGVAKGALLAGAKVVRAHVRICDIGFAIDTFVKRQGYVVNRKFCGHTIGAEMHMKPQIPMHYDQKTMITDRLEPGQMICIEPMITKSDAWGYTTEDKWTRKTQDGKKSAFFEYQLKVTEHGCQILTPYM